MRMIEQYTAPIPSEADFYASSTNAIESSLSALHSNWRAGYGRHRDAQSPAAHGVKLNKARRHHPSETERRFVRL